MLAEPSEAGDVTLAIDLSLQLPKALPELIRDIASLRRHATEWPYFSAAQAVSSGRGDSTPPLTVLFRPNEPTYIVPRGDKLVVVYTLLIPDPTERALARVVAQELSEAKASGGSAGAPSVTFSDKAETLPLEIRGLPRPQIPAELAESFVGYVTVTCFARHLDKPAQAANTASVLAGFRYYLDNHIKASKTYLHSRMRTKLDGWLGALQSAAREDPFASKEKKTISGRTFVAKQ